MKRAVIIGASSGIGYELAKVFSKHGYTVGLAARRVELLKELQQELSGASFVQTMDLAEPLNAVEQLKSLIAEMGGVEVIVINSGTGHISPDMEREQQIVVVNAAGFAAVAHAGFDYLAENGGGQLVGVSSIAAIRGARLATAYNATKAFVSSYLAGLRNRSVSKKLNISVTEIRPGFVATDMTKDNRGMFWVASAEKAANQIYDAIQAKKKMAYITKRWWLVAQVFKLIPDFIFNRY